MKRNHIIYIVAIASFIFPSCQKVIHIDLNSADPKYVVEGNISNQAGPQTIKLSKTVSFESSNVFPAVSGALVTVTDATAGITDTLQEGAAGYYTTISMTGVPGHTYQLYVKSDSKVFTSTCTMPLPVTLDSLYISKSVFGNTRGAIVYTDPAVTGNYYYFAEYKNSVLTNNVYIRSDELRNGQVIDQVLSRGGGESELKTGDYLTIAMQCIDSAMYQYYFTLQQTKNQNAATPSNPQSNIVGGALGYFSAHTVSSKSVLVN
ncbi:DUF4249 domain-containing protein [Flavipsychrobacter stenotrophus]|uniref:DUF4249 domain-containing protein n=1 Tax=Flavipsychrobacter stenotrophus TaxID=2077091 RepID=A0A2S7T279_9BACT|nr:DUF4249 domain-containing protein [Flavipsychrobacter stenotrophus]PQJ12895.1 DUF4249 domain-containing protein [Flavipsychrobacter stenotrophus]